MSFISHSSLCWPINKLNLLSIHCQLSVEFDIYLYHIQLCCNILAAELYAISTHTSPINCTGVCRKFNCILYSSIFFLGSSCIILFCFIYIIILLLISLFSYNYRNLVYCYTCINCIVCSLKYMYIDKKTSSYAAG